MSLQFEVCHRSVVSGFRNTGIPLPWLDTSRSRAYYKLYNIVILVIVYYQLGCCAWSVITIEDFQDKCRLGNIISIVANSAMLLLYYIVSQKQIRTFSDKCNNLSQAILDSDLEEREYFRHSFLDASADSNSFTKKVLAFVFWTPVIYCLPIPVIDAINGSYRSTFPLPILAPYDAYLPGVYEVTVFLHILGLLVPVMHKFGNDCFFLSFFKIHIVYLKYLSASFKSIGNQFNKLDKSLTKQKLISWIELHQKIIRSANDLISLYTPVICIYYANLIVTIVFGIFTQIKNDKDGMIQRISLGGFCALSLIQLYLQCSTNEEVGTEAEKVSFEIYNAHWYELDRTSADMMRLMLLEANRPIDITAFKAPTLRLNREAFLGFIASTITAVMTFSKMNDLRNS